MGVLWVRPLGAVLVGLLGALCPSQQTREPRQELMAAAQWHVAGAMRLGRLALEPGLEPIATARWHTVGEMRLGHQMV